MLGDYLGSERCDAGVRGADIRYDLQTPIQIYFEPGCLLLERVVEILPSGEAVRPLSHRRWSSWQVLMVRIGVGVAQQQHHVLG